MIPLLFMILVLAIGYGKFKLRTEPLLILSAFVAGIVAKLLGYSWKEMQEAIIEKNTAAMPATLILWSVGFIIGSWKFSGTVLVPLVPWSAAGAYMAATLGVPTLEYFHGLF